MEQPEAIAQSTTTEIEQKITFTYGIRPIYYLSRVYGVMPFSIIYGPNGEAREPSVNKSDVLWFIFWVFLYSSIIWVINYKLASTESPSESSAVLVYGGFSFLMLIFTSDIVIMAINLCNRFKLIDILSRFTLFDAEASTINASIKKLIVIFHIIYAGERTHWCSIQL